MEPGRQHVMAALTRGGVPALACLCCSFCAADPDVVFWTLAPGDGTPRDGGGVTRPDGGAAGPMTVDAEILEPDGGGTTPELDAGFALVPPWCVDGGLADLECTLPSLFFTDGGLGDVLPGDIAQTDGGSGLAWVRVEGPEQCGDEAYSYYVDESEWWSRYVACPKTCEGLKSFFSSLGRIFFGCEAVTGR